MATANFTFTTLTGTETAGWNSINTLLTSIDTQLNASNRLIYMSGWSAVAGQTIKWDAVNSRWVPGTLDAAAFANNSVELGTKTTGDYVASIAAAGTNEVSVTGSGEGAAATVRLANNTALRGAATVETPPTYSGGSTGTVGRVPDAKYVTDALAYATAGNITLTGDVTVTGGAATIANNAISQAKMADNSVGTAEIIDANVTYAKLGSTAKRYDVITGGAGLVFTSSGNLSTTSASTNPTQQPLVVVDSSAGAVTLTLPTTGFSVIPGATITIAQTGGSNPVTIQPGTSVFINGSNSNTYTLGGLYSVVTLILFGTGNTWIITGDFI